ncbi:septum formation initiator family protein [Streptomyces sp. NA02950]|uniref:FtsB family cell division protein n=1 Tax=Streptomyces sp. NA02950 TaxID=2742137 RepID=UPI001590B214|nr:septum formation initiator family protein [Streptomyces sp. NA02950]QKV95476.1 septum formation initiator family protein [Streptomyces sp. NA02950]
MSGAGSGTAPKRRPVPGATTARRAPFVLLVVVLLGSGLIGLLVLNSSLNQGSFEVSRLEKQTDELTDDRQALEQDVDRLSAPGALERRARELGMVPGGSPAFLKPDGTVSGVPAPATAQPTTLGTTGIWAPPALDPAPSPPTPTNTANPVNPVNSTIPSIPSIPIIPAIPSATAATAAASANSTPAPQ